MKPTLADGPLHESVLTECLELATMAPSVHNSQPWRFRLSRDRIEVITDLDHRLAAIDAAGREAAISVGAAILNLRVAILAAGRTPLLALLPQKERPDLAAVITIGPPLRADLTVRALSSAITRRRTNRRPFRDVPVRDEVLDELSTAARAEGAQLAFADGPERNAILSLMRTANEWQRHDPAYIDELAEWTSTTVASGIGIPSRCVGPLDSTGVLPLRDFGLAHPAMPRRTARFEPAPTVGVLYTATDTPIDWLRAGQALERVLLTATVRGLSNTPSTAPTELPALRSLLADTDDGRAAQVVLRLGYGELCAQTPRRPIREVVERFGQ